MVLQRMSSLMRKRQLMRRQRRKALRYDWRIMVKLKEEIRVFYMSSDQPQSTNMMEPSQTFTWHLQVKNSRNPFHFNINLV